VTIRWTLDRGRPPGHQWSMRQFLQSPRDPAFVRDPFPAYEAARALIRPGGPQAVRWDALAMPVLINHADVSAALRDPRLGREVLHVASRDALGWPPDPPHLAPFRAFESHSLLDREPPTHTRLRRLVLHAFTSRAVARAVAGIEATAAALLASAPPDFDIVRDYARPLPLLVIADLLGAPRDAAPQMLAWSGDMVGIYQARRDRAAEDRCVAATVAFSAFMEDLIAARRRAPGSALIDDLIAAEETGERLSGAELVATCILLMNAGHEATSSAIANAVHAVLAHDLPRDLFHGPGADRAVDELLRWDPPLHLFTRYALADMTVAGVPLRMGDQIGLLLAGAGRDGAVFADPSRIDPTRANASAQLGFGAGIHFCVGAPLARAELRIALGALFARLPDLAPAAPAVHADRWHFRGLDALAVTSRGATRL
jgi:cytochrome P450